MKYLEYIEKVAIILALFYVIETIHAFRQSFLVPKDYLGLPPKHR